MFFKYLSPAVIVLPLMFLFFSRATPMLSMDQDIARDGRITLQSTPDIIFLVLDEFPLASLLTGDLEINRERYPNFARLADQSNWYLAATTGAVVTVDAVPEALTGRVSEPDTDKLPIAAHFPRNLFTLLQDRYDFSVMESATRLCPRRACSGTQVERDPGQARQGFVHDLVLVYAHIVTPFPWAGRLPSISDGWSDFGAEQKTMDVQDPDLEVALGKADLSRQMKWNSRSGQFREFIGAIRPGDRPGLHYLHTLLPHRVWRYLPDGRQYLLDEVWAALDPPHSRPTVADGKVFGHVWQNDELAVNMALQRHILQVRFTDRLLGELLDHLEDQSMLRDSLLVVMGDHGASFVPGQPRRAITSESLSDISAIPLFIKLPGQNVGNRITAPAALMDILPTIVDALDIGVDWPFSGRSLLTAEHSTRQSISVKNSGGSSVDYPADIHLEHLANRAAGHENTFGRGTGPEFYRIGPFPELSGVRPEDHGFAPPATAGWTLDAADLYRDVDTSSDFVPLHVTGKLEGVSLTDGPAALAISVNGVVQATTRTYTIPGFEEYFASLLPPGTLREGENELLVFTVTDHDGFPRLRQLKSATSPIYQLDAGGTQILVKDDQARSFALRDDDRDGHVLTVEDEGGALVNLHGSVSGQTASATKIIAFKNGQFAGSSMVTDGQFRIALRSAANESMDRAELRVFALDESGANELSYPEPCSALWHFAAPPGWAGVECAVGAVTPLQLEDGRYRAALNFGRLEIRPYMGRGWEFNAGEISWATGQQADLVIPVPKNLPGLRLEAMVQPFLSPPVLNGQNMYVLANDERVGSWQLNEAKFTTIEWQVPVELLRKGNGTLTLSFLMPDAASPKALGAGEDLRILGLAFMTIEMESSRGGNPP